MKLHRTNLVLPERAGGDGDLHAQVPSWRQWDQDPGPVHSSEQGSCMNMNEETRKLQTGSSTTQKIFEADTKGMRSAWEMLRAM